MKNCDVVKMSKCFWCGGIKNELILPKRQNKAWCDNKNMAVIINYDPCDKCQEDIDDGTWIIEAQDTPVVDGQPEIQKDAYPTGHYWVVQPESAIAAFSNDSKVILIDKEAATAVGLYEAEKE